MKDQYIVKNNISVERISMSDYILAGKLIRHWHRHTTTPNSCLEKIFVGEKGKNNVYHESIKNEIPK